MTTHKYPTLYKRGSTGKIRFWTIIVSGNNVQAQFVTERGTMGGSQIAGDKPTVITEGKQKRTVWEQAMAQAKSKWQKKVDEGYVDDPVVAENQIVVLPMLAQKYKDRSKHIVWPAIGQRKFDGVRCMARMENDPDNSILLTTRKGKALFPHLNIIRAEIKKRFLRKGKTVGEPFPYNLILDGELYAEEADLGASSPSERFQILTGLVRRQTLKAGNEALLEKVVYKVYDCYNLDDPDMDFTERHKLLKDNLMGLPHVVVVENFEIADDGEVKPLHDRFVTEGYEGLMVRNKKGAYALDKRSNNLLKYKDFQDAEYEIVGYEEGVGRSKGLVIWICKDPKTGKTFKVKPDGTNAERADWFKNGDSHVGKEITVRFFELTGDGVPRFPTGGWFRDYE
tara:strand:+ start:1038 stop:2225 length:1188 start_codon:yes stop_codon:yes gene_type:complete